MLASIILGLALLLSIAFNIRQYLQTKALKKTLSVDARQLLHDLTHGGSIVKVTVIDPQGLLLYRGVE